MVIEIIIPTYNRLNYLIETLQSVLLQKVSNNYSLKIVVSDNSTNDETEVYFKKNEFPGVKYIRRRPSLAGIDHLMLILKEIKGDLFMIFHDDDVMREGMVDRLANSFESQDVGVASNAYVLKNREKTKRLFTKKLQHQVTLTKKKELLGLYLYKNRFVPYPGYMYKREMAEIEIDKSFGKHVDVYFLSKMLEHGSIKLLNTPLYYYRMHEGQDSFYSDYKAKSLLVRYIISECGFSDKQDIIISYRLQNIYDELRTQLWNEEKISRKRVFKFFGICFKSFNMLLIAKMTFRIIQFKFR